MTASDAPLPRPPTGLVERVVGRILFWGGLGSIAVLVLGMALYALTGGYSTGGGIAELRAVRQGRPPHVVVSLRELVPALVARPFDPVKVMTLGTVLLLVVPVAGVAAAIPAFAIVGDRRYAFIAAAVLGVLVIGFLIAGGVG